MAKIDVSKIEGYADMSAEDKLKALESYDLPTPDYTGYVKKEVFDKTASELAEKKKELKEKMSADEQAQLEAKENVEKMQKELETLRRESNVSKSKAKFLALGYDEKLAEDTANAVADGDMEKVFANEQKHLESFEKQIRADVLKKTPKPEGGAGSDGMTLEKFRAMNPLDRHEFAQKNPEEYKALYTSGGND